MGAGAALLRLCFSLCWRRLARVTVLHGCLGCRTFELPPSADVGDVKARIDAEAGFPAARQRLWHCGREVREGRNLRCRHVGEGDERMTLCCGKCRREVAGLVSSIRAAWKWRGEGRLGTGLQCGTGMLKAWRTG